LLVYLKVSAKVDEPDPRTNSLKLRNGVWLFISSFSEDDGPQIYFVGILWIWLVMIKIHYPR